MNKRLENARIDAIKSATEIINSISKSLRFRDLDLLLINMLMISPSLSFYAINDEWQERDYRHVGLAYGGGIAAISILLYAVGLFIYLPIILSMLVACRYIWLRKELTDLAKSEKWHKNTLQITKYMVLYAKSKKKTSMLDGMSVKYTLLRYIKDKDTINGANYLNLFAHIDSEIDFYGLLHGVIDDVLTYAIEQETGMFENKLYQEVNSDPQNSAVSKLHHEGPRAHVLSTPPEKTHKGEADANQQGFALALGIQKEDPIEPKEILKESANHDPTSDKVNTLVDSADEPSIAEEQSAFPEDSPGDDETDNHHEEDTDSDDEILSLDDIDTDDFNINDDESNHSTDGDSNQSGEEGIDDFLDDFDDEALESLGLSDDDVK